MLYREIIVFCSQIHTKHKLCCQNVELLNVKLVERIVTIRLSNFDKQSLLPLCCLELVDKCIFYVCLWMKSPTLLLHVFPMMWLYLEKGRVCGSRNKILQDLVDFSVFS